MDKRKGLEPLSKLGSDFADEVQNFLNTCHELTDDERGGVEMVVRTSRPNAEYLKTLADGAALAETEE
jgi:hypothetical protein